MYILCQLKNTQCSKISFDFGYSNNNQCYYNLGGAKSDIVHLMKEKVC